jgi:hypothetical protein
MLLTDVETTVNVAANMQWKGEHPVVTLAEKIYEKRGEARKKRLWLVTK